MAIRVALHHKTEYHYDRPVTLAPHVVRLRPAPHCRTPIVAYSLKVQPDDHFVNWQQDPYSNYLARFVFAKPSRTLAVAVDLIAELSSVNPFDFFVDSAVENFPFAYDELSRRELAPYLATLPAQKRLLDLVEKSRKADVRTIDYLVELNRELHEQIGYVIRMEPGVQEPDETLEKQRGSCRDSSWLLVQLCRHLGLAARFVSGYLIQLKADLKEVDGPSGPEKDFVDLHAWAEVYLPGAGWIGFDPTSGLLAGEGHIPLACSADPSTAAPISGSYGFTADPERPDDKVRENFRFRLSIQRVAESPRVTRPYTDEQWQAIDKLGLELDRELDQEDVRLTMGGEPTFVAVDKRDEPEWNTLAPGDHKRELASKLLRRLHGRFAPGGLLHHGQGKFYPGESLPRWALSCYWRLDGVPLWNNPRLLQDENEPPGHGIDEARRFLETLAGVLGVDPTHCTPAYEDLWYFLWRERNLPVNVDAVHNNLEDEEERARIARVFDHGLSNIVGFALPLYHSAEGLIPKWVSGHWLLQREHLFLTPGDAAMGYRLPLESLPWQTKASLRPTTPLDPSAPRKPLPPRTGVQRQIAGVGGTRGFPIEHDGSTEVVRTALCVEPRDGRLHVFIPPIRFLEDYLELIESVEAAADELNLPVVIEGYQPPDDHRLQCFQITPDPGVLEVNIQPAHGWRELSENTVTLYEEARQVGLTTEKYMLDGRTIGTGGGNHIVIGGPTPADSPLLRRPDLLRSLVGYWQNHPALSYLFSGMFVGPTCQAPRVDEARLESLYELELAFQQVPERPAQVQPWAVDRIFRHLLADMSGNTHRAEFCIDKLYNPDSSSGRRGLLELRSFEMPPHPHMSLVQNLLLRALVGAFWKTPYTRRPVRWGNVLHDRFLLPHFVEQDLRDVLEDLKQAGYPFDPAWFAPHFEFRFPVIGSVAYDGVNLELRHAIEPWLTLGEEPGTGGPVRYVDSSLERLQVKVTGLTDDRYAVTCNGRRVTLHPTGANEESVAGVRFRAWQPPSCLHPTIGVHSPLVFELIDAWRGQSLGGCTYHVAHPGGRAHDTQPVNASEAQGRRRARFFPFGHAGGAVSVPAEERRPEQMVTLDLRQAPPPGADTPALVNLVSGAGVPQGIMSSNGKNAGETTAEQVKR